MPIALLSDFGTRDYYVGAMKGVILSIAPDVMIVDITHEVSPQRINEGAFILEACYRNFPPGTVFVAVVDPGVGSKRKPIAVDAEGFRFVAPDNGLLSFLFEGKSGCRVHWIADTRYMLPSPSSTFHGRDVFAPAAAHLANGADIEELGSPVSEPFITPALRPRRISDNGIAGRIQHIDRFGNLITNLDPDVLSDGVRIQIKNTVIDRVHTFFAEAAHGEPFAIKGSAGFVEIVVRDGSAQSELNVTTGDEVLLLR